MKRTLSTSILGYSLIATLCIFFGCEDEDIYWNAEISNGHNNPEEIERNLDDSMNPRSEDLLHNDLTYESDMSTPSTDEDISARSYTTNDWVRIDGTMPYLYLNSTAPSTTDWSLKDNHNSSGEFQLRNNHGGSWHPIINVAENGNVGIGTTTPENKLDVVGTIRAEEIIVETGWADYVFEKGHEIPSLEQVEAYIHQKGHLPGVPSAREIQANGVSLGESQTILLAKIEELTLHAIAQQKEIEALKKKIHRQ